MEEVAPHPEEINLRGMIQRREQQREQMRQRLRQRMEGTEPPVTEIIPPSQSTSNITRAETTKEDEEVCRVCRSGNEPNRPLFYPCRCNGSIKYVHQDCLLTWLSHSRVEYCELCKTKYTFTPIYAADTPSYLPIFELAIGGLVKLALFGGIFVRLLMVIITWMMIVPVLTAWTVRFYFGSFTSFRDMYDLMVGITPQTLAVDSFFGLVLCTGIVILSLSLGTLLEYVQSYMLDNQQRQGRNQENRELVVRDIRAIQQEHQQMLQRAEGHEGGIVEFLNQIINLINAPIQFNDDIEIDEFSE